MAVVVVNRALLIAAALGAWSAAGWLGFWSVTFAALGLAALALGSTMLEQRRRLRRRERFAVDLDPLTARPYPVEPAEVPAPEVDQ